MNHNQVDGLRTRPLRREVGSLGSTHAFFCGLVGSSLALRFGLAVLVAHSVAGLATLSIVLPPKDHTHLQIKI